MKKIIISLFLLCGFVSTSNSQVLISLLLGDKLNSDGLEFGLEGGFNWSTIGGLSAKESLSKFNLGFYFDIRIKNRTSLYTGVLVKSEQGINGLKSNDLIFLESRVFDQSGTYSQNIRYFVVPALIKYKFDNRIYLEAGPQTALMSKAWVEFNSSDDEGEAKIKTNNEDDINRIDFGVTGGFGYRLRENYSLTIGVKYYYGLVDVYKNRSETNNESLMLKINVPIGAGKAKEKE